MRPRARSLCANRVKANAPTRGPPLLPSSAAAADALCAREKTEKTKPQVQRQKIKIKSKIKKSDMCNHKRKNTEEFIAPAIARAQFEIRVCEHVFDAAHPIDLVRRRQPLELCGVRCGCSVKNTGFKIGVSTFLLIYRKRIANRLKKSFCV